MSSCKLPPENLSIDVAGQSVDYAYSAAKPGMRTLVFIPGLFAGGWMWKEQNDYAVRLGYGTVSINEAFALLHFGREPIKAFRQVLELLFDRHEIDCPILCGNSLGGLMAVDYGVNGKRSSLVLGSGIPGIGKVSLQGIEFQRTPSNGDIRVMLEGIFHDHSKITPEMIPLAAACFSKAHIGTLLKYLIDVRGYPIVERVNQLGRRLALIWGEEDKITPTEQWRETFAEGIRSGLIEFSVIPKCGHSPMLENADAFNSNLGKVLVRFHHLHGLPDLPPSAAPVIRQKC